MEERTAVWERGWMGDGAGAGLRGRGIVVVRWVVGGGVCFICGSGGVVVFSVAAALTLLVLLLPSALTACVCDNVPFARTSSRIRLVAGVTGVGCSGASFFTAVGFVVFTSAFFSFFSSAIFPFAMVAFVFVAFFVSTTGVAGPASLALAFFGGRWRLQMAGGSTVVLDDMFLLPLQSN